MFTLDLIKLGTSWLSCSQITGLLQVAIPCFMQWRYFGVIQANLHGKYGHVG
jgi:hypothetical protein